MRHPHLTELPQPQGPHILYGWPLNYGKNFRKQEIKISKYEKSIYYI